MIRVFLAMMMCLWAVAAAAQSSFGGLARVDMDGSRLSDTRQGLVLELALSQGVPWRVFTLEAPERLVVDFREVDWRGVDAALLDMAERAREVRMGSFRPGWSRMVITLAGPYAVREADMALEQETGAALLSIELTEVTEAAFAAASGAPELPGWDRQDLSPGKAARGADPGLFTVVIDPGHGGIDPGAEKDGLSEKDLMLAFARELKDVLLRQADVEVVLTREDDSFVSLERRVAIAHQAGAGLFISLHADALIEGRAHGATVYTLSDSASDRASAALAERHDRADLLAGIDLTGSDDVVADVLMDLARMETQPRAEQLAKAIQTGIRENGLPLNSRPMRMAGFSVLKSPDIPSVLLEVGFLSSDRDRANIADADWRARMAQAVSDAVRAWRQADAANAELVRQ
ncbi:N-acetylmuramoyl-L-alanine amidase [Roseovarius atlanticus]|uniref:N-acetylmuramoyl-L-alanine amidase n=1 Tax=Roseovarius atlanticus TaxID=1641875 RepID=UPI001C97BDE4|nr:N-acetylmuramoyl-L-alanine amidase [Roseovarius atlanticus]MBY5988470.1 N-acetylmuramoyl-L-alanine amidase [Roseovarius atlanticus]MBY6123861.1 N-acetylmuramoyl-L-alanine amidase [Roseovarius atlanticus]MBY6148356.1 N-acetylmuramoyl-L-alanine amidase [Roseovarius atlanticus]